MTYTNIDTNTNTSGGGIESLPCLYESCSDCPYVAADGTCGGDLPVDGGYIPIQPIEDTAAAAQTLTQPIIARVIARLTRTWTDAYDEYTVEDGGAEAFMSGVQMQIDGYLDMSAEDMTDEIADIIGWQLPLTDAQADIWTELVTAAAMCWMDVK